jgi:hypothetical protein
MKIIISVDAIKAPLTGIGRYTWELANRIPSILGGGTFLFWWALGKQHRYAAGLVIDQACCTAVAVA